MPFRTVNSSLRNALALSHWLWYVKFYHHFLISFLFSLIISMSYLVYLCISVLTRFSCVQLCNPVDCSPPGSSVHGILQTKLFRGMLISSPRIKVSKKLFECHWFVVQNVVYFTLILRNRKKLLLWPNICLFCVSVYQGKGHTLNVLSIMVFAQLSPPTCLVSWSRLQHLCFLLSALLIIKSSIHVSLDFCWYCLVLFCLFVCLFVCWSYVVRYIYVWDEYFFFTCDYIAFSLSFVIFFKFLSSVLCLS